MLRQLSITLISILLMACNLVKWNQKHLTKKYHRKGIEEKYFENEEHKIHYFEGGEGETILLIHGFGGDAQVTWNKSIQDFAKEYHVIAPDLLWFGQSSSTAKAELFTQVDAILDLLAEKEVSKISVVGISYGGFVTLGLVYAKPELFERMIIVDSPGITYDASLLHELAKRQNEERFQDIFVVKNPTDVDELFHLAEYKPKKIPKGILEDAYDLYFDQHHDELDQLLTTLPNEQEKFKSVDVTGFPRTLVVWGAHDEIFPPAEGKKFAKYLDAEYKEVPNSGHAPNLENFKVFQSYLREFIAN